MQTYLDFAYLYGAFAFVNSYIEEKYAVCIGDKGKGAAVTQ